MDATAITALNCAQAALFSLRLRCTRTVTCKFPALLTPPAEPKGGSLRELEQEVFSWFGGPGEPLTPGCSAVAGVMPCSISSQPPPNCSPVSKVQQLTNCIRS